MDKKKVKEWNKETSKLTLEQDRFCQFYVSEDFFGHGTDSYCQAYDIDLIEHPEKYNSVRASASKLLANKNVLIRINELLDSDGLNNAFVDKQKLFLITQNADLLAKQRAIDSFDKVNGRIKDRVSHEFGEGIEEVKIVIKRSNKDDSNLQHS